MQWCLRTALILTVLPMTAAVAASSDWMFRQGYYTHSPISGVRIAQYTPLPWVAPLPDSRLVTSGYRRSRTTLRGPNGTVDDHYRVENWSNGRGGLDAEWERVHDAWRSSVLSGSYGYGTSGPGYGVGGYGYGGYGYGGYGYGGYGGYGAGRGDGRWGPGQAGGGWSPGYGTVPPGAGAGRGYGGGPNHGPGP